MMCDSTINYCSPSAACFVAFLCGHAASQLFCAVVAQSGRLAIVVTGSPSL